MSWSSSFVWLNPYLLGAFAVPVAEAIRTIGRVS